MFSKIKSKVINNKFNLVITIVFLFVVFFNIFAYLFHNSTVNRLSFFADGLLAQILLYRIIMFVANKCSISFSKNDYIILGIAAIITFGIYFTLINIRNTVYVWDNTVYYNLMNGLLQIFDHSPLSGLGEWFLSGMVSDYGDFLLIFIYPFYAILGTGIHQFIYSYFLGCVIPVITILYIFSIFIANNFSINKKLLLYKILTGTVLISFPLLHAASILGQPDIFGLSLSGIIVLLTINYDFSTRDITRWIVIFFATVFLVLTRRWYMFFILAYYISYFIILFAKQLIGKDFFTFKKSFINTILFGLSSFIVGCFILYKLIFKVLKMNYSEAYNSWYRGGFGYEIINQFGYLGLFVSVLIIIGWIYGVINKKLRYCTLTFLSTYVISIFAFTKIQNMGQHQSLILLIPYIYGIFLVICILYNSKIKYLSIVPVTIIVASMINCTFFNLAENPSDFLLSKVNLYPKQRTDLEQINKVVTYLNNNIKDDESVIILAGSNTYDCAIFTNYPDVNSNQYIGQNNFYAASGGFPENFFTSKYVVLLTPIQEREQVKQEAVLSTLVKEFTSNDYIKDKFSNVYSINLNLGITATIYQRNKSVDNTEVDIFINDFKEYCQKYPDLFYNRLCKYKK